MLLGMNLLDDWSEGGLLLVMAGLLAGHFSCKPNPERVNRMRYWVSRRWLFGAFMANFLLFILLGGWWASSVQVPITNNTAWGSHRVTVQSDTLVRPEKARSSNPSYYEERLSVNQQPVGNQAGKRIGFVLLFVLGITLNSLSLGLACNLACAGNGALAVIVLFAGVGIMVSSFFLLSRAFGSVVKPWKQIRTALNENEHTPEHCF